MCLNCVSSLGSRHRLCGKCGSYVPSCLFHFPAPCRSAPTVQLSLVQIKADLSGSGYTMIRPVLPQYVQSTLTGILNLRSFKICATLAIEVLLLHKNCDSYSPQNYFLFHLENKITRQVQN